MQSQKRGVKNNFRTCALPHYTGSSSSSDEPGARASVWRVWGSKYLYAEIHNKQFKDHEEASKAISEKGYGSEYFSRQSIVNDLFKDLKHCQQAAEFDALYRYWVWLQKTKLNWLNKMVEIHRLRVKLDKLAKKVGIFHPCTKIFDRADYPLNFVDFTCPDCQTQQKHIWPYQGLKFCSKCNKKVD